VAQLETNNEELLQMAVRAAKAGQKDGARVMFRQVYNRNKNNETAMMWLAKLSKTPKERVQWLERILEYNPDNAAAKKALKTMAYKREASNNRILLLYGSVGVVMLVLVLVIITLVVTSS